MNKLYLVFVFCLSLQALVAQNLDSPPMKFRLMYFYDPLCGWCYGFSPVIQQFAQKYSAELEVMVISGGMVTGEGVGPIGEIAPFVATAYKNVENATGVKYGEPFLKMLLSGGKTVFNSTPPSIALSLFKTLKPEQSLAFAARIQKAIYYDGLEPENLDGYGVLAAEFGLNSTEFVAKMKDPQYLELAQKDFELSGRLGIQGFPTVVIAQGERMAVLSNGYASLADLEKAYQQFKRKAK